MSWLLVTNDDGVDSPALVPLLRALSALAPVRAVVPDVERSWISKAVSRWNEVRVDTVWRGDFEVRSVGGFPADCANLGIHSLFDARPRAVVAGVNIGLNSGIGFFLSSGTVGAAMEGWIAGLPAFAFSVGVPENDRDWKRDLEERPDDALWERAAALSASVVAGVLRAGFPEGVDLLNVNFPREADLTTPRVVTRLARVAYPGLFRRREDGRFVHDVSGYPSRPPGAADDDVEVLRKGWVSITPVGVARDADVSPDLRRLLETCEPLRSD